MQSLNFINELELLIKSRHAIIFIETSEEERVHAQLKHLADNLGIGCFIWTVSKGLRRLDQKVKGSVYQTADIAIALGHVESSDFPAIYYFQGVSAYFDDQLIVSRLKDAAKTYTDKKGAIIIAGLDIDIPQILKPYSVIVSIPEPTENEYRTLLQRIIRDLDGKINFNVQLNTDDLNKLLNNLKGLTIMEAEKILTKAIVEDGTLSRASKRATSEASSCI